MLGRSWQNVQAVLVKLAQKFAQKKSDPRNAVSWVCYFPCNSRSKRGLPRSGAKVGSILSQPGER